jgi:hypothetical protein
MSVVRLYYSLMIYFVGNILCFYYIRVHMYSYYTINIATLVLLFAERSLRNVDGRER